RAWSTRLLGKGRDAHSGGGRSESARRSYERLLHRRRRASDHRTNNAREQIEGQLPTEEELAGLTEVEREELFAQIYVLFVSVESETGICDPGAGCTQNVLPPSDGFWDFDYQYHYMAHGNGRTTFVTNEDEMRSFLGDIDTAA